MKAIMVMYDSLNRNYLQSYGCGWTHTPNFLRLAQRAVQFENCYVGSMPCMPARRELHTGRPNFLHRSWGPIEPFDDSMPEILKRRGIHTHLVSDHMHYWEDGGSTYHTRYSSWEVSRGQEGDGWKADLKVQFDPARGSVFQGSAPNYQSAFYRSRYSADQRNRNYMDREERTPQAVTFAGGLSFIEQNHDQDSWFLQIETFDPHEPFYTLPQDRALYPDGCFVGDANDDWPPYAPVQESEEIVQHVRNVYAALVSKCDRYLGKVLDLMDRYDLWKDTMLIVNTDHGFLLGDHGWWGKGRMPIYEEIAHIPLYIWDPRLPETAGQKRNALVQTIDLPATLLEFFGINRPEDMMGQPLFHVLREDLPVRDTAVFGYFGSQMDITDGRYLYHLSPAHPEVPVYEYTLMPTHMLFRFTPEEIRDMTLAGPFSFTKGCRVMKIRPDRISGDTTSTGTRLYDLAGEGSPEIQDPETEAQLKEEIRKFMLACDAPEELYDRMGMTKPERI